MTARNRFLLAAALAATLAGCGKRDTPPRQWPLFPGPSRPAATRPATPVASRPPTPSPLAASPTPRPPASLPASPPATPPPPPPALPDLALGLIRPPAAALAGQPAAFVVEVRNRGQAPSGATAVRLFQDGGAIAVEAGLPPLAPGQAAEVELAAVLPEGRHRLRFALDPGQQVAESDEADNSSAAWELEVRSPPPPTRPATPPAARPAELAVANLALDPARPLAGAPARLEATIENRGGQASAPFTVALRAGTETVGWRALPALAPGAAAVVTLDWVPAAAGEFELELAILPGAPGDGGRPEDDRRRLAVAVQPPPRPDLALAQLRLPQNRLESGAQLAAAVRLLNRGQAPSPPCAVLLLAEDRLLARAEVPALAPGEQREIPFSAAAPEAGRWRLSAVADPDQAVDEEDENNNRATGPALEVRPAPRPRLEIAALDPGAGPAFAGAPLRVLVTVVNRGAGASPAAPCRLCLDGQAVQDLALPALPPGGQAVVEFPLSVNRPGNFSLTALLDPDGAAGLGPTAGQGLSAPLAVLAPPPPPPPPPPPAPELAVEELRCEPASPREGQQATVSLRVVNRGPASARGCALRLAAGEEEIFAADLGTLAPGQQREASCPWTPAAAGPVRLAAWCASRRDPDERRGAAFLALEVQARPRCDLAVAGLRLDDATIAAGQTLSLRLTVQNRGRLAARGAVAALLADGAETARATLPDLPAGRQATVNLEWTAPAAGRHALLARLDPDGALEEDDESNNDSATQTVTVTALRVDLQLAEAGAAEAEAALGQPVLLRARARNAGPGPAPATRVLFLLEGRAVAEAPLPALRPGAAAGIEVEWTPGAAGTFVVTAAVETPAGAQDPHEENNRRELAPLTVRRPPAPDLAVAGLALVPDQPPAGGEAALTLTVANAGDAPAAASQALVRLDNRNLSRQDIGALDPGAQAEVALNVPAGEAGRHTLEVRLDAAQRLAESDEDNNVATREFLARVAPETLPARFGAVTAEPQAVRRGQNVTLTVEVVNQTDRPLRRLRVLIREREPEQTLLKQEDLNLEPGATARITHVWRAGAPGVYQFGTSFWPDGNTQREFGGTNMQAFPEVRVSR